jgi:integrase/recombinase XerD
MVVRRSGTNDPVLAAFDEHLRRTRGTCPEARHNYVRYVRVFLAAVLEGGPPELARISPCDVIRFVRAMSVRYRPRTVKLVVTSLRSFFRFLRGKGWREDRLEDSVPTVPLRRRTILPKYLGEEEFARLIASLDASSPRGLRDRAILLCLARLGLRASEIARLQLEDIGWRAGTVHVRTRKTGRGAVLPLPHDLGRALVSYLRRGRPITRARHVFVLHRLRPGEPVTRQTVGDAVKFALRRAGISAPMHGANLLRHTLATSMVRRGASLKEIADVFGHRSIDTTAIYAKVDLAALREVALPWPEVLP